MSDDLDCSRRHGAKTIIAPLSSDAATLKHNDLIDDSSSTADTSNNKNHNHHALHQDDISTLGELDGQLSAMQSAAAKTALVVGKRSVLRHDLVRVAEEDEDEDESFSRHWIFRRRVGFEMAATPRQPSPMQQPAREDDDVSRLKLQKEELLRQLNTIRQQRQHSKQVIQPKLHSAISEWNYRLVSAELSHDLANTARQSLMTQRKHLENEYSISKRWHVLSDAFFIWHNGPFATINGTRMGRSARTPLASSKERATVHGRGGMDGNSTSSSAKASFFSWGETNTNTAVPTRTATNMPPSLVVVPWNEINSALGQIVFLLYTMQHIPYSGIEFQKHVLQPCGSASKIGFLKNTKTAAATSQQSQPHQGERRRITALAHYNTPTPPPPSQNEVTWYNLHHYEENGSYLSIGYYSRRNFNVALEGLVYCIAEACLVIEKRDMALSIPYIIRVGGLVVGKDSRETSTSNGASTTVGGLSVSYDPEDGERWTVVWRYLLTDLKWLIAYFAKHVDR
ncbi:hypothetical protein HJC23_006084 [Cyclotella cryptica]|uniref:Atg6 BARA domain-containing protein n=1 Tax=Cyclotella cryptica TaxID=29204 RepID=A0ABD3QJM9_9STRA|eukprot:CCRYP_004543-RA/>CCRYP_004543-RA protein AED:0.00 eAED:0.00 QI:79/-1/1/1/-1/1/1/411/510